MPVSYSNLYLRNREDALVLYEAASRGLIPTLTTNLAKEECSLIKPGTVFIWRKSDLLIKKNSGILRWTDDKKWGVPRRVNGVQLFDEQDENGKDKTTPDALIRVLHRAGTKLDPETPSKEDHNESWHLAAFYLRFGNVISNDPSTMHYIDADPLLSKITPSAAIFSQSKKRGSTEEQSSPSSSLPPSTPEPRMSTRITRGTTSSSRMKPRSPLGPPSTPAIPTLFGGPSSSPSKPTSSRAPVAQPEPSSPITVKPKIEIRDLHFRVDGHRMPFTHFRSTHSLPLPFGPPDIPHPDGHGEGASVDEGDCYTHEHIATTPTSPSISAVSGKIVLTSWIRSGGQWKLAAEGTNHPLYSKMKFHTRPDGTPNWITTVSFARYEWEERKRKRDIEGGVNSSPRNAKGGLPYPTKFKPLPARLAVPADTEMRETPSEDADLIKLEDSGDSDDGLIPPPSKRAKLGSDARRKEQGASSAGASAGPGIVSWAKSLFTWSW